MFPDNTSAKFHSLSHDGRFSIAANQLILESRPPVAPIIPDPYVITILASGMGMDGIVNVGGSQGVRVTGGPPSLPPTGSESTNGVEVAVGETQEITLQRGLIPGVDQQIEMTPSGITIDAGSMPVTIQSLTQVTLSVAGGMNTITLSPEGITIQGVMITIQGALVQINS